MSCPSCSHTMQCLYTNDGESAFWCPRCGTVKSPWLTSPEGERPKLVERCREFAFAAAVAKDHGLRFHHEQKWKDLGIPECLRPAEPLPPEV